MSKKIYFKIGSCLQLPNRMAVLPVTLTISDSKGRLEERSSYLSIMPEQLSQTFNIWKNYIIPDSPRRPKIKSLSEQLLSTDGNISLQKLAENLKTEMNQWLTDTQSWINERGEVDSKIQNTLEKYANSQEEIQLFIQTEDRILRGFPWQEWEFLYPLFRLHKNTELSVSATDFARPEQKQTINRLDTRVRILAIFADNELDENNEYKQEKESLDRLKKYGAFIQTLYQPNYSKLIEALEEPAGWHIFFFAGHSHSNPDGRIGWLQISWLDDNQKLQTKEIEINELTKWMQKLINDKLQLAIFNSCDGLGLANQLTSLNLPYCIVMRERVDSFFAGTLLNHLLKAFVEKEKSIFASMRYAREQLLLEYDKGAKPSGKSWLPVIVANPEAFDLTWDSLFIERRFSSKIELILLVILMVIVVGLPLSILGEFGSLNTLQFYAQLYPHIIVYPSLFLPLSLFSLYRAFSLILKKTGIILIITTLIAFASVIAIFTELNSDPLFLFEIKPDSSIILEIQELNAILISKNINKYQLPPQWLNEINLKEKVNLDKQYIEAFIKGIIQRPEKNNEANGIFLSIAHSHQLWSKHYSISRFFYLFNYWAIFFCAFELTAFLSENIFNDNSVFNIDKYLKYILLCDIGLLLWIPFDNYYTKQVKSLLFQTDNLETNLRIFVYLFIAFLLLMTIVFIIKNPRIKIWNHKASLAFLFISIFVFSISINQFILSKINQSFGIASKSLFVTWTGGFFFLMLVIYPIIIFLIEGKQLEKKLVSFKKLINFLRS